jgi:hypothetical protein
MPLIDFNESNISKESLPEKKKHLQENLVDVSNILPKENITKSNIKDYYRKKGFILISQSLITKLIDKRQEEVIFCPRYIHESYILKSIDTIATEPMQGGSYFETGCLGSGVGGKKTIDLPRKVLSKAKIAQLIAEGKPLIGEKKIDQLRIDIQIERFKLRCQELGINIIPDVNTQIPIIKTYDNKYLVSGELDIFPTTIMYENCIRAAIIDLKLSGDVNNTSGHYCWGTPQYMDPIQGDMYHYLIRDIDFNLNPHLKEIINQGLIDAIKLNQVLFLYWIFGKKEPLHNQEKFVEREYNPMNIQELKERIRKTIYIIEREEQFGWIENPCDNCNNCALNKSYGGECQSSIIRKV